MIPAPLPPQFAVRYALPEPVGDLGSSGLRSPEPLPLTAAEQEVLDRFRRAASSRVGVSEELRLFGDRPPPRALSAWDEVLERWVDPRLRKEDGLGWFRPDAAYEAPRAPLQQRESGFNIGIKYRWSF